MPVYHQRYPKENPMVATLFLPLALNVVIGSPATPSRSRVEKDPPVKVWLSSDGDYLYGQKGKAYARTAEDGYLVVLHADTHGRVRVLFPVDPGNDQSIKGGKKYEIKARGNREALAADDTGRGVVLAAFSKTPFAVERFAENGHWDYRALSADSADGDLEARLMEIVGEMQPGDHYVYDAAGYVVTDARYGYGRGGLFGRGPRFGISVGIGRPFFGRSLYDPFYYDPFFSRFGFGYGNAYRWGGIRSWGR
jgi:hypothetical protein